MNFTVAEVAKIIECCKAAGVAQLILGELRLEFSPPVDAPAPIPAPWPKKVMVQAVPEGVEQLQLGKDELTQKEDQLAMMLIEDPLGYEKLMLSGELDDA